MDSFNPEQIKSLYRPARESSGEDNGQVTIIGGSDLFHGAPLLSLKVASRLVDMVFFASPEPAVGNVAELMKSKLSSFIWVPFAEVEKYIEKSDAVLIGPGLMRYRSEKIPHKIRWSTCDAACRQSREITQKFLTKYPHQKWVIDAGSLQVMDKEWIPQGAILTPNRKEYQLLFGEMEPAAAAKKYNCTLILKGPRDFVCSGAKSVGIKGGNVGMAKGGTGDVLAGLTVALLAKNEPFSAACAASFLTKAAGDELYKKVKTTFNADDLAEEIPLVISAYFA